MASATDTLTAVNEAISIFGFYQYWKNFATPLEMYFLCNKCRQYAGLSPMSRHNFDKGWEVLNVFAKSYSDAMDEFTCLVLNQW